MGSKPPFERLRPLLRLLLFWLGVLLVVSGVLTINGRQLPDLDACRSGGDCVMLSQMRLKFAWTAKAYKEVEKWSDATRKRAAATLLADSWLLVPGYVLVLSILCGAAARRDDHQRSYRRFGVVISWLVFVAGAADLAENTLVGMALESATGGVLVGLAMVVIVKWALVILAALYATFAPLSRWILGRI